MVDVKARHLLTCRATPGHSAQVKSHVVLTRINGVLPRLHSVTAESNRPWNTLLTRVRSQTGWRLVEPPWSRRGCYQLAEDDGDEGTREMNEQGLLQPEEENYYGIDRICYSVCCLLFVLSRKSSLARIMLWCCADDSSFCFRRRLLFWYLCCETSDVFIGDFLEVLLKSLHKVHFLVDTLAHMTNLKATDMLHTGLVKSSQVVFIYIRIQIK